MLPTEQLAATILLADDDEDARCIFETLFEIEGFRVLQAVDGPSAVEMARRTKPDVVLLNLVMPYMSGHQVLQAIRSDSETATIPCLLLTGDARYEQMGRALLHGADGFLTKPAEPRAVLNVVRRILDERYAG